MSSKVLGNLSFLQVFSLALVYLALSVYADKFEQVLENGEHNKLFYIGQPMELQCKPKTPEDGKKIYWMKEKTPGSFENVTDIPELKGHYYTVQKDGKFIITKPKEDDAGTYSCHLNDEKSVFRVWAQVVAKVVTDTQVTEGEPMTVVCIVKGTEPKITWFYKPETKDDDAEFKLVEEGGRLKIEEKENNNDQILTIEKAQLSDRGYYRCNATNDMMGREPKPTPDASDEKFIRIKDKMAPVWPAIGIAAQIIVFALVIIISERRRKSDEVDDSDTDEGPEKKEDVNFIRNRN